MPGIQRFDTTRLAIALVFAGLFFLGSKARADFRGEVYPLTVVAGQRHGQAELSYGQTGKIAGTMPANGERVILRVPRLDRLEIHPLGAGKYRAIVTFPPLPPGDDPVVLTLDDVVLGDGLTLDPPELCQAVDQGMVLVVTADRGALPEAVADFQDDAERQAWDRSHALCDRLFGEDEERMALWIAEPTDLDAFLGTSIAWDDPQTAGLYCATTVDDRCWDRGLPHGLAALMTAIETSDEPSEGVLGPELVALLQQAGISIELPEWNTWESAPLALAVEKGAREWVDALIAAGADLARHSDDDSLLQRAASRGRGAVVDRLLAAGADPNSRGGDGWTPLIAALNQDEPAIARRLLEAGADPNLWLDDGRGPLAFTEDSAMVRHPLTAGARPGTEAADLLHRATERGDRQTLEQLLDLGVDPDIRGPFERTPLMTAAQEGNPRVVELLFAAGASPEAVDEFGENALRIALDYGHREIVELLR